MSDQNGVGSNYDGAAAAAIPVRQKGRRVPELPTYVFVETGVEVKIRRLGPFTMDELRKALRKERKPPKPPSIVNEVGDARVKIAELNFDDPGYKQELREYNAWLAQETGERMTNLMTNYCIIVEPEAAIVEEKRALLAMIDPTINDSYSDKEVYVRHYLMGSSEELERVQNFILNRSMPTEEAVQEHIESFPGDVQGEESVPTPGAPIRLQV